jgi:outer membrane lipoprotein-sorting protein
VTRQIAGPVVMLNLLRFRERRPFSATTTMRCRICRIMFVRSVILAIALCGSSSRLLGQGDSIIRAMHDRYAKTWYRTLRFTQKTTLRTPADTIVVETWKEVGMFPGRLRIDIQRATGNLTAIYAGDSLFIVRGDTTVRRTPARNILLIIGFDVYAQPVDQTLAALRSEHYPTTPVREDTWEGRPVYVIGTPTHQLWIDKDRLLFVRSLQPNGRDTTKTDEYRFDHYVRVPNGWLAEQVEAYSDGTVVQREEYRDVRTNVAVDSGTFTPSRLTKSP